MPVVNPPDPIRIDQEAVLRAQVRAAGDEVIAASVQWVAAVTRHGELVRRLAAFNKWRQQEGAGNADGPGS